MKKIFILLSTILATTPFVVFSQGIGTIPQLQQFVSTTSPVSGITQQVYGKSLIISGLTPGSNLCLDANNRVTTTGCTTGGGGSGSGTWATTTSTHSGRLINYPLNTTDIVTIGSNATTTAEYYFDPNTLFAYLSGRTSLQYASTTQLDITGTAINSILSTNASGAIVATSTITVNNIWATSTSLTNYFAGNVGIGTTTPGATLDVNGGGRFMAFPAPTTGVGIEIGYSTGIGQILSYDRGASVYKDFSINALTQSFQTSGQPRITIINSGNVGIGTTTPGAKFDVTGGDFLLGTDGNAILSVAGTTYFKPAATMVNSNEFLQVKPLGTGTDSTLQLHGQPSTSVGTRGEFVQSGANTTIRNQTLGAGSQGYISFDQNGTSRLRIDTTGNVGIGTTNPQNKLDVQGQINSGSFTGNVAGAITVTNALNTTGVRLDTSSNNGLIRAFDSSNNTQIYLTASGNSYINQGNVGIGTTTPAWRLQVAGTRPDFAISDSAGGTNSKHIVFSNRGGNMYIGTSSDVYATSTSPFMSLIASTGEVATRFVSVLTKFVGVISSAFTPSTEGEMGIDTTSNQFKYFSNGAVRVVSPVIYTTFTVSTSTTWTATTTKALGTAYVAETWVGIQCFTDTGTLNVSITDGTNRMNMFNASTTVGTVTLSTNNTWTAGEKRYVDIGTPASSPTYVSCTVAKTIDAD